MPPRRRWLGGWAGAAVAALQGRLVRTAGVAGAAAGAGAMIRGAVLGPWTLRKAHTVS